MKNAALILLRTYYPLDSDFLKSPTLDGVLLSSRPGAHSANIELIGRAIVYDLCKAPL